MAMPLPPDLEPPPPRGATQTRAEVLDAFRRFVAAAAPAEVDHVDRLIRAFLQHGFLSTQAERAITA